MGFWSSLLKTGGKAISYGGKATVATGKSVGNAVLHPSQTLRGAGSALKTATVGGAVGYVGWEKLTTDKSVVRIVSDAVIGEEATNAISGTAKAAGDKVSQLTDKAEQTMANVNQATSNISSTLNGASTFLGNVSNGNGGNMLGNFFSNLANGKVSGMSIAGLIAGACFGIRPFRMARQDCRCLPDDDDHRQSRQPAARNHSRQRTPTDTLTTGRTDP